MMLPESIFSVLAAVMGFVQAVLAFHAAHRARTTLQRIESPAERRAAAGNLRRPAYGFTFLAVLSFLVAAVSVVVPSYLKGLYGL